MEEFAVNKEEGIVKKVKDPMFWCENDEGEEVYIGLVHGEVASEMAKSKGRDLTEKERKKVNDVIVVACDKDGNIFDSGELFIFAPLGIVMACSEVTKRVRGPREPQFEGLIVAPMPLALLAMTMASFGGGLGKSEE